MKNFLAILLLFFFSVNLFAQTSFQPTVDTFKNGEIVWRVINGGLDIGEFWPIHGINLVTKETDPVIFNASNLEDLQDSLRGVATAPDGMTKASIGGYQMEGKGLSNGRPCGDGSIPNYGILIVKKGFNITFTHKSEISNFDSLYFELKKEKATLAFLPSIYRQGRFLSSQNKIEKVIIRRNTPTGVQMGVIVFNPMVTCDQARSIVLGLDRPGKSTTTHIYVLDGGPSWGQYCKEVNRRKVVTGTRNPNVITNYFVFY